MENLVGKMVIGDSGCMHPTREGQIIATESHKMFGDFYIVAWENGKLENFYTYQIQPISKKNGIGVYLT